MIIPFCVLEENYGNFENICASDKVEFVAMRLFDLDDMLLLLN